MTTIDLPADLAREIEARAAARGEERTKFVTDLLRKGLQLADVEAAAPPVIKPHPRTGLPYVECRHAADHLSPPRVAEILLDQEVTWHHEAR